MFSGCVGLDLLYAFVCFLLLFAHFVQTEAQKFYQRLVLLLFKHIEDVAASNPKYEHMVRLENYHFFSATVRPLKVSQSAHGEESQTGKRANQAERHHGRQKGRQAGGQTDKRAEQEASISSVFPSAPPHPLERREISASSQ